MADNEKNAAAPSKSSKLVLALVAVNSVLLAGGIAAVLLRGNAAAAPRGESGAHGAEAGHAAPGPTIRLADFIVHLRNADSDRYARISFELEVKDEKERDRIGPFVPRIRDGFLSYLSDRSAADLQGSGSLERTKEALTGRIRELAPGVAVRALYVTDLVIQ